MNVIAAQLLSAACSCPQPHARRIPTSHSHSAWAHQVMVQSASLDIRRAHRVCMHSQKLHAAHAAGSHTSRTCLQLPLHQAAFPLAALYASIIASRTHALAQAHQVMVQSPSLDGRRSQSVHAILKSCKRLSPLAASRFERDRSSAATCCASRRSPKRVASLHRVRTLCSGPSSGGV